MRYVAVITLMLTGLVWLAGCGSNTETVKLGDFGTRDVTLPGGQMIRAEVVSDQRDMERGLMFRESLAPNRGMLFVYPQSGQYRFWMFQTLIPLDIIWLDSQRRVVEISADTPPCKTAADKCPTYGGNESSQYILELAGGSAKRYSIKRGDVLTF